MDRIERARYFIRSLQEKDYLKLKRSMGVGLYLFNLLKDYLSSAYLDMLKEFDKLPVQKRIAILEQIKKVIELPKEKKASYNFDSLPKDQ